MTKTKARLQNTASEECGVWLDTVQLKKKSKQKRAARPISKLLFPSAEGDGYSLAVAINFTQTKMSMPKTKQSSISSFFTSHRRVLNKMSSEEPNPPPPVSLSSSPGRPEMVFARKEKHNVCLKNSVLNDSEPRKGLDWKSEKKLNGTEATLWLNQDSQHSISLSSHCESEEETEECKSPQKKKILSENSLANNKQLFPLLWSEDSVFSQREISQSHQKSNSLQGFSCYEPSFFDSLHSEQSFRNHIDVKKCISTQKSTTMTLTTEVDENKENSNSLSCSSNTESFSLCNFESVSNYKWEEPQNTSPQKHQLWWTTEKNENFDTKRNKLGLSYLKKPLKRSREADDENLANLFTQDSEGFRVIAHRDLQKRSPVKHRSNQSTEIMRSIYENVEEDEDEMLFTQDSQGHVVIKH